MSTNPSLPQTLDMASSVPVVDLSRKRKHEEGSNDAVSKNSNCDSDSDSDSDFACEAPSRGTTRSTVSGKILQSGIRPVVYQKSSNAVFVSSTKEASSVKVAQNSLASTNAPVCSASVPEESVDESDSDGEEAAQVEEVQPTIRSAKVTLSSDTNRSITKSSPSFGLTSSLKTDYSAIKVSYPLYQTRLVNTNSDLARMRNLGNESNMQSNSISKYTPFHPLYNFTSQMSRNFNPTLPPPPPTQPLPPPPPPPRAQPPPPFNFYMPSPSSFPTFRPFFPPFLNLPPPLPHPPFPPPPTLNNMTYPSFPPR